jgi:hypothetical protein
VNKKLIPKKHCMIQNNHPLKTQSLQHAGKKLVAAIALVLICFFSTNAQTADAYLITNAGEKVIIEGNAELGTMYVSFQGGPKGKTITYLHTAIKLLTINNRLFLTLPLFGGKMMRLEEIVCYNDKYILTTYFDSGHYIVLFDWDMKIVKPLKLISNGRKKQIKNIEEDIKPYFGDCKEVMDKVNKQVDDKKGQGFAGRNDSSVEEWLMYDINVANCGGTKNINDFVKKVLDKPEPTKKKK